MSGAEEAAPGAAPGLLRIVLGLLAGWAVSAGLFGGLAWLAEALTTEDPYAAAQKARFALFALAASVGLFTLTLAPLTVFALLRAGRRGVLAFLLGGAAAGLLAGVLAPLIMGDATNATVMVTLALAGALHLGVTRAAGGIRRAG